MTENIVIILKCHIHNVYKHSPEPTTDKLTHLAGIVHRWWPCGCGSGWLPDTISSLHTQSTTFHWRESIGGGRPHIRNYS